MVERRQDPGRERRWATALNQADQRVQIHAGLTRELLGQRSAEAGLAQACAAPGNRVRHFCRRAFASRLSALSGLSVGPEVHAYLAPAREPFLRGKRTTGLRAAAEARTSSAAAVGPEVPQAAVASS